MRRLTAAVLVVLMGCSTPGPSIESTQSPAATLTAEASPTTGPTNSPLPSTPPLPTASQVASASRGPDPCAYEAFNGPWNVDALWPGAAVKVVVAELNIRAGPCTSAKRMGTLKKGDIVIVSPYPYGPFEANGFPWYLVRKPDVTALDGGLPPLPLPPIEIAPWVGGNSWIAANDGTLPYVTPVRPRCPTLIDLESVRGMLPAERLACFADPITLEGTFGCGGCGGAGGPIAEPGWLATWFMPNNLRTRWDLDEDPISIHFKPSGPVMPPEGSIIRVTVHIEDPAALRCSIDWVLEEPPFKIPERVAIAYCRETLVVESYEILGTDPNYPG